MNTKFNEKHFLCLVIFIGLVYATTNSTNQLINSYNNLLYVIDNIKTNKNIIAAYIGFALHSIIFLCVIASIVFSFKKTFPKLLNKNGN